MTNDDHLFLLLRGSVAWNQWRQRNPKIRADLRDVDLSKATLCQVGFDLRNLSGADLSGADLSCADLSGLDLAYAKLREADFTDANLTGTNLFSADLFNAILYGAKLTRANLGQASLTFADLRDADLTGADLSRASLDYANLCNTNLSYANLSQARLLDTVLGGIDFTKAIGLTECDHTGPSFIDHTTLLLSTNLPISFLRGCGLPDLIIEYLPSLRGAALQFYSCFISYSSKDQLFADRLHADLQNAGVRCWFAPHDLPIGAKIWDVIDEAIRLRDKLLVILSEASIGSDWVEDEPNKAYAEERDRETTVLFPVRLDDVVMTTPEPWARKLRDQRNIGDFRNWRRVARYKRSLERLLRDLKTAPIS
jgi:TIR domain/Pentapeptide repeats (8 copies)